MDGTILWGHCTTSTIVQYSFLGGLILHKARGCAKCGTKKACKENFGECDCEYHNQQQEVSRNSLELRVRRCAIEDPDFPSEQVISL